MPIKKYYSAVDSIGFYDTGDYGILDLTQHYTGHEFYLLRYAHTLLTYAEAKARDGQLDATAYEAVNLVRRRANHVDLNSTSVFDLPQGLTTNDFIDSVLRERALEFCGEPGNLWFDILRTEQTPGSSSFPTNVTTHFYEIPSAEKSLLLNFQ
jgi:hypothetical protein